MKELSMRGPAAYRRGSQEALELFSRASAVNMASLDQRGRPLARALHVVTLDGALAFHASLAGEKLACVGQPAVLTAHELVAEIPSHFVDPELACPATTYYRSAMAHGVLREVEEPARKAAVLEALMQRFQPEGGYAPIFASDPRYTRRIAKLLVVELRPERIVAKFKLGQNKSVSAATTILAGLWRRGRREDLRAIMAMIEAHPQQLEPDFLRAPQGLRLELAPSMADAVQVAALLDGAYWLEGLSREQIAAAHVHSGAWVLARDADGRVVGSARALSDGARMAWILDVIVAPAWRGRGVGRSLVELLLDHPMLREVAKVGLRTRDAVGFYAGLGFSRHASPFPAMLLEQPRAHSAASTPSASCTSPASLERSG